MSGYYLRKSYETEKKVLIDVARKVIDFAIKDCTVKKDPKEIAKKLGYGQSFYKARVQLTYKKEAIEFINNLENSIYWDILNLGAAEYKIIKKRAGLL